jgi:hypothetical protein
VGVTRSLVGTQEEGALRLSAGQYASFVVRVWSRRGDLVQGQITHTATRRTVRFRTPQSMLAFILAHLGAPQGDAPVESTAEDR